MMLKLIKLEWKKNNIGKSTWAALIMTAVLCFLIVGASGELLSVDTIEIYGKNMIDATVEIFTHMSYIIFAGVMLAGYIVGAYEKRMMNLMFSYPINRKKIILSKVLAVWIFNVTALICSKVLICLVLLVANPVTRISVSDISIDMPDFWFGLLFGSAAMVSIAFIALPIGLIFRSTKATIVAAVIIACLTQGNIGSYTLAGSTSFYMILLGMAAVSVYLSVFRVEQKDVM